MEGKKSTLKTVLGVIGTVFFFLTFIVYVVLIMAECLGITKEILGSTYVYGFDALKVIVFWITVIPVLPVCIIYEIIFALTYIRKRGKGLKIASIAVTAVMIIGLVIPGIVHEINKRKLISDCEDDISDYLDDKYGDGFSDDISISIKNFDEREFYISTPALPEGTTFELDFETEYAGTNDDLINIFANANSGFIEDFDDYLDHAYSLPDNMDIDARVLSIDLSGFRDGDDYSVLFDSNGYKIRSITVTCDDLDDDSLVDLLNLIDADYIPVFGDNMWEYIMVYVYEGDEPAYSVQITPRNLDGGEPDVANISVYSGAPVTSELDGTQIFLNANVIAIA